MCKETNQNDQSNVENKNLIDDKRFLLEKIYQFLEKEIALFWTRFWIFGALITAILIGWYNVITNERLNEQYNFLKIVLPFFATIIALIQTLINRGAKRWLDYWEKKLENDFKDNNIYDKRSFKCYNKNCNDFYSQPFSPAKLGIMFTDLVTLNCLLFTIFEFITLENKNQINNFLLFFFIFCSNILLIINHLVEILMSNYKKCNDKNCNKCKN